MVTEREVTMGTTVWHIDSKSLYAPLERSERRLVEVPAPSRTRIDGRSGTWSSQVGRLKTLPSLLRSLATLIQSGIRVDRALLILAEQAAEPEARSVFKKMSLIISTGHPLSRAMDTHSSVFPKVYRNLVRIGEETGGLDKVLVKVADLEETAERQRAKIKSGLVYPAFLCAVALLVFLMAPGLVLGDMQGLFKSLNLEMPAMGAALLRLSSWTWTPWFWMVALPLTGTAGVGLRQWASRHPQRVYRFSSSLPGLGKVLKVAASARFAAALGAQLKAGVPVHRALQLAAEASGSPELKKRSAGALRELMEGATMTEVIRSLGVFDPMVLSMVEVGATSGKLAELMSRTAVLLELELERVAEMALSLLEPVVMTLMGIGVGILAFSLLSPMTQLLANL